MRVAAGAGAGGAGRVVSAVGAAADAAVVDLRVMRRDHTAVVDTLALIVVISVIVIFVDDVCASIRVPAATAAAAAATTDTKMFTTISVLALLRLVGDIRDTTNTTVLSIIIVLVVILYSLFLSSTLLQTFLCTIITAATVNKVALHPVDGKPRRTARQQQARREQRPH